MRLDVDVAGQQHVIGYDDVVFQNTIMGHVSMCHQVIVVPDNCGFLGAGTPMYGDTFSDDVTVPDFQNRLAADKVKILGNSSDDRAFKDLVLVTHQRMGFDHRVRAY